MKIDAAEIVAVLFSTSRDTSLVHLREGLYGKCVGRNNVWKIINASRELVCYVKMFENERWFRREAKGREIADTLAAQFQGMISGKVIFNSQEHRAIVSEGIPGRSYADIFSSAYRIDRNLFRTSERLGYAEKAFSALINWLEVFHNSNKLRCETFYDHSTDGVRKRILFIASEIKWNETAVERAVFDFASNLNHCSCKQTGECESVFGDVCFDNFFFDGVGVGAVDFEDIGFGNSSRDWVLLDYYLRVMQSHNHYYSSARLTELIGSKIVVCGYCRKLFCLEKEMLALKRIHKSSSRLFQALNLRKYERRLVDIVCR